MTVLWGWKSIAAALGRSERWAKMHASELPLSWVRGRPVVLREDLYDWLRSKVQQSAE